MIEPLTDEPEWEALLAPLPAWVPDTARIVVVSPHPDDETLGCGGLIASATTLGVEVAAVAVTDGEAAYPGEAGLAETRIVEQTEALARLGVRVEQIHRFRLPDGQVTAHEGELQRRLAELLTPETLLLAPWRGDYHPDHEACGRAAEAAARQVGASVAYYFFWTWHRGTPEVLDSLPLRRFALDEALLLAKTEALDLHVSQLQRASGDPILPGNLLGPAKRNFEVFLVP